MCVCVEATLEFPPVLLGMEVTMVLLFSFIQRTLVVEFLLGPVEEAPHILKRFLGVFSLVYWTLV